MRSRVWRKRDSTNEASSRWLSSNASRWFWRNEKPLGVDSRQARFGTAISWRYDLVRTILAAIVVQGAFDDGIDWMENAVTAGRSVRPFAALELLKF